MNAEQKQMCKFIAEHYGEKIQEIQAVQEFTELMCILTRRADQRKKMDFREELKCELADCLIMIEQLQQIHGISDGEIFNTIEFKLARSSTELKRRVLTMAEKKKVPLCKECRWFSPLADEKKNGFCHEGEICVRIVRPYDGQPKKCRRMEQEYLALQEKARRERIENMPQMPEPPESNESVENENDG